MTTRNNGESQTQEQEDAILDMYLEVLRKSEAHQPVPYDDFLGLILRDLERDIEEHLDEGSLAFPRTEDKLRRIWQKRLKLSPIVWREDRPGPLEIVMNNRRSGPRTTLFDEMLGKGCVKTDDYAEYVAGDFKPTQLRWGREAQATELMLTALQKSLKFLQQRQMNQEDNGKLERGRDQNIIVISEITRMFYKGMRLDKAKRDLPIGEFLMLFTEPDSEGIEVITAVSIVNSGWFLREHDFAELARDIKDKGYDRIDAQKLQDYVCEHGITDPKYRLLYRAGEQERIREKLLLELERDPIERGADFKVVGPIIAEKLCEVMERPLHDFRLGYGRTYLHLCDMNRRLSSEDWRLMVDMIESEPLRYSNLLDLPKTYGFDTLMNSTFSADERNDLQEALSKDKTPSASAEALEKLEKKIRKSATELAVRKPDLTIEDILHSYHKAGKHKHKAAGLAVQERELFLSVDRVEGNPFTIVGLPVEVLFRLFHEFHVEMSIPDISREYWPDDAEQAKISEEDTMALIGRKEEKAHILSDIRQMSHQSPPSDGLEHMRRQFDVIHRARQVWALPELMDGCLKLYEVCYKIGSREKDMPKLHVSILRALNRIAGSLSHSSPQFLSLARQSVAEARIDYIGHLLNRSEDVELGRRLPDDIGRLLDTGTDCLPLEADPGYKSVRQSLYWNENQPVIERGILEFRDYLQTLASRKTQLLAFEQKDVGRTFAETADNTLRDAFRLALAGNIEIEGKRTEHIGEYLVDDWEYFVRTIRNMESEHAQGDRNGLTVFIALGNNGKETMAGLWQALIFLKKGWNVTIAAKSRPMMIYDCHVPSLYFVIPYFDHLVKQHLPASKVLSDYLGKELTLVGNDGKECVDDLKHLRRYVKRKTGPVLDRKPPPPCPFDVFILTGERWYMELVGKDEFAIPPHNPWKGTVIYTLHAHKNRRKPLAIMNERIFSDRGGFVYQHVTTGWYVAQLFRPEIPDRADGGWKSHKEVYTLHGPPGSNLIEILDDQEYKANIRRQICAECRAYAGLQEYTEKLTESPEQQEVGKRKVLLYKSPHKFIRVEVEPLKLTVTVLLEYENGRIRRTGGTQWQKIKGKIPSLIRSIFTGLIYRGMIRDGQSVDPFAIMLLRDDSETKDPTAPKSEKTEKSEWETLKQTADNHKQELPVLPAGSDKCISGSVRFDIMIGTDLPPPDRPSGNATDATAGMYYYARMTYSTDNREYVTRLLPAVYSDKAVRIIGELPDGEELQFVIDGLARLDMRGEQPSLETRPCDTYFYRTTPGDKDSFLEQGKVLRGRRKRITFEDICCAGVVLAPMDYITNRNVRVALNRTLHLTEAGYGNQLIAHTELIRIGGLFLETHRYVSKYWDDPNFISGLPRMEVSSDEGPLIYQLAGPHNLPIESNADEVFPRSGSGRREKIAGAFAAAALLAEYMGAAAIDINMGCCPLFGHGGGIRLAQEDHELAFAIVKAVGKVLGGRLFVSAKTRLIQKRENGTTCVDEERSIDFYRKLKAAGVSWLTVHTRVQADGQGFLNDGKARVKRASLARIIRTLDGILPIIGNGEIVEADDFTRIKEIGCCAAMIGLGMRRDEQILVEGRTFMASSDKAMTYQPPPYAVKGNSDQLDKELISEVIRGYNCDSCAIRDDCLKGWANAVHDGNSPKSCIANAKKVLDGEDIAYVLDRLNDRQRDALREILENRDNRMCRASQTKMATAP